MTITEAWIAGRLTSCESAVAAAVDCLAHARFPVIAGLGGDVAAIRSALRLAHHVGAPFDHMESSLLLPEMSVMQRAGWMCVSPAEATRRCDLVLTVGKGANEDKTVLASSKQRSLLRVNLGNRETAAEIAILRAIVTGQPASKFGKSAVRLETMAKQLLTAKFGVVVWQPGDLDEPSIEMLMGLVRDLNRHTRFTALPLSVGHNGYGAIQVSGWLSGFPVRTSLANSSPDFDPWRYDAKRLASAGEVDAIVWLSAFEPNVPVWVKLLPSVALVAKGYQPKTWPSVVIEVGTPGVDHDGVIFSSETGSLQPYEPSMPSAAPRAHEIVDAILQDLERKKVAA